MSIHPHPPESPQPAASEVLPTIRHDGWTRERQVAFLTALAATHSVAEAAREAGMSRQSAYKLRARLHGEPFDLAWNAAFKSAFDRLAEAAMERAMNGVEVPHYHKGELIGTSRRYDERLTVALMAMRHGLGRSPQPSWHPAGAYDSGDFGKFLARVEEGPETWAEQQLADLGDYQDFDGGIDGGIDDGVDDGVDDGAEADFENAGVNFASSGQISVNQ